MPTSPIQDRGNAIGRYLARTIRENAEFVRRRVESFPAGDEIGKRLRSVAGDLEALAWIADHKPEILNEAYGRTGSKR